ncbi:MAG: fatty acid hydroxylase [Cytophagales bacterium CG12_big_fil_rev_8_21_14_0_65_40_12]|nr:MAG: fatty acid hydroxylase [Cytophagales bacterium CG12_big_fil_rev_8_21_14_0_65_40_12]PIW04178.1 MAG: fatty acid hydroxylase [Cytophagales bacterium CG17_big_fil_post_rev_8_21_14_2_50_40_13]
MMMAVLWLLIGFVLMETFSWWIHKYVMHGVLWKIHKTHHQHTKGYFELNDLFTLLFGGIAVTLILLGASALDYRFWMGCGISLYGLLYFFLHDVLIHKRLNLLGRPKTKYLRAITKAHRDHHKTNEKDDAVSFGLFIVPKKYFSEEGKN